MRYLLLCLLAAITAASAAAQTPAEKLAAHSEEFRQEVITVTEGVHVAVGFGLANSILIEGDDGLIVVDTMESPRAAEMVKAEFDKISDKPVKGIIYTHNHYDHVYGASIFAGADKPEVLAHALLPDLVIHQDIVQPAIFARSARQFGIPLPPGERINCGIGPQLNLGAGGMAAFMPPTQTFDDRLETEIAGVKIVLQHAPGETDDQLYVWLPEKKVLLPGDNWYKSFPNLYAIRGTPYRDVRKWADSVDKMLQEKPEFLVPSHTRPVSGAAEVEAVLTNYRDAIRFVFDETVKGMNAGKTPDQLAHEIVLPEHLASQPYLQPYYGTVPWSVRAIFAGLLGWFDGNATSLFPLPASEKAQRMAELAGGDAALFDRAKEAAAKSDHQWAAELFDHVLALQPDHPEAKQLKANSLRALGEEQTSANGRNYYLTSASQLR